MSNFKLNSIHGVNGPVIHCYRDFKTGYMEIYQIDTKSPELTIVALEVSRENTYREEKVTTHTYVADGLPISRLVGVTSPNTGTKLTHVDLCFGDTGMVQRVSIGPLRIAADLPKTAHTGEARMDVREDRHPHGALLTRIRELEIEVMSLKQSRQSSALAVTAMRADVRSVTQIIDSLLITTPPPRGKFRL